MKKSNLLSGLFFILVGTYLVVEGRELKFGSFEGPQPGFFPVILGVLMILLSVVLIVVSLLGEEKRKNSFSKANLIKVSIILGSMVACGPVMELVGYLITIFLWFSFVMLMIDPRSPIKAFFYGAIASPASYVLFKLVLQQNLPAGFLGV